MKLKNKSIFLHIIILFMLISCGKMPENPSDTPNSTYYNYVPELPYTKFIKKYNNDNQNIEIKELNDILFYSVETKGQDKICSFFPILLKCSQIDETRFQAYSTDGMLVLTLDIRRNQLKVEKDDYCHTKTGSIFVF